MRDLAAGVAMYISKLLQHSDVFVVFDCYFEKSLKSDTQTPKNWELSTVATSFN